MTRERHYPVGEAALELDAGADRETRTRPCCARVGDGWCVLPTDHAGDHIPPPPRKDVA